MIYAQYLQSGYNYFTNIFEKPKKALRKFHSLSLTAFVQTTYFKNLLYDRSVSVHKKRLLNSPVAKKS